MTNNQYSDSELLSKLADLGDSLGRTPTTREVNMHDHLPHTSTFHRRFGSFNQAIKLAGLESWPSGPSERSPVYSDEELIEAVQEFVRKTGRVPSSHDVDVIGDLPGFEVYQKRFGSWRQALGIVMLNALGDDR